MRPAPSLDLGRFASPRDLLAWPQAAPLPIGVGAGVVDRLRQLHWRAVAYVAGSRASKPDEFLNLRAESYWRLRKLLEAGEIDIPNDLLLFDELAAIK